MHKFCFNPAVKSRRISQRIRFITAYVHCMGNDPMRNPKASILIVEDDPAILTGLQDVLVFNGYRTCGVSDGGEGLKTAMERRFDLILLDVMLPTMDGFSICREVRKKKPDQAIIMLTAKGAEDDVVAGFKVGADDYISKPFSLRELMVRVEAVLRRSGKDLGGEQITIGGVFFDGKRLTASVGEKTVDITRREMDILVYLYRHNSRIVSKKELLTKVWQYKDVDIETRTVEIHIQKFRKKMEPLTGKKPSRFNGSRRRLQAGAGRMKRLRLFIIIFFVCLSIPMAYFILRTQRSLAQEELSELRYFAETLFDEMETEFSNFVNIEESRAVDEFDAPSQLSEMPGEGFILGYFQNNPDGSFQTPHVDDGKKPPNERRRADRIIRDLNEANILFNAKRTDMPVHFEERAKDKLDRKEKREPTVADRYLDLTRRKEQKVQLGQKKKRVENITVDQALKLSQQEAKEEAEVFFEAGQEVEVDPLQSVFIDDSKIVFFRRIVIDSSIYRQGLVILVDPFLDHLARSHFLNQPMSQFTRLTLSISDHGGVKKVRETGADIRRARFTLNRRFPRPFSFLSATMTCEDIPRSSGRNILNAMLALMAMVIFLGLFAIYRSARTIVDMSERRSQFVSSVTHELKTPLTNIRMYIEMLEQGIAPSPDRERDYLRILNAESSRLSRLINNVLEFSKLERKNRQMDMSRGTFDDVIGEVKGIMGEKLLQEGFRLKVEKTTDASFLYDREVMIQVMINLMENSMKFGKDSSLKEITLTVAEEESRVKISHADTGPGIPRHALKDVFNDFFRVDNELTRTTRGTGIGLSLVKKFITAMGGEVSAKNNEGPGCTITLLLPK